jgi:hypothetical protein
MDLLETLQTLHLNTTLILIVFAVVNLLLFRLHIVERPDYPQGRAGWRHLKFGLHLGSLQLCASDLQWVSNPVQLTSACSRGRAL